jgi:uncharacterized protein YbbC (DUF1343 family)
MFSGKLMNNRPQHVELGLERLLEARHTDIRGAWVGLICNQASVDHSYRHAADLLHSDPDINLRALFGPQHGIRGDVQDTRKPTDAMLQDVDVLVFDMQDVGCRIYTFVYTLANCMRAAQRLGKRVVVCDRPNPINGASVAGNILEPEYASFVGQFPLPTRHGMTVGELARMFNEHFKIGCDLEVIPMDGWKREFWHDDTDAPWVLPSPNIPTLDSATVFPGTVHFEGTQVSEGRGTTKPFELIGAPYIDPDAYAEALNDLELPGVFFRACAFQPTFQKHAGVTCGGVQIHVLDRDVFEPWFAGIAMAKFAHDMYTNDFRWKVPPYEYVYDKNPFDVISGTAKIREAFENGTSLANIESETKAPLEEFKALREAYLLYR